MGRYIICGIATKIKVETRLNLQENREEALKRIASTFDLKYYDIIDEGYYDFMYLTLKEDLFNMKFKDLLLQLAEIDNFRNQFYYDINSIKRSDRDTQKDKKEKVMNYLNNSFDLYLEKDNVKNKYYLKGVDEYSEDESPLNCESYFNCTNMSDETLFNDNIERGDLKINFNYLLLYFQADTTYSEDICFTLNF